jgi:aspartate/tyrosine/aromatic aminotransferase
VGALTIVTADTAEANRVLSRVKLTVRANYSNPPAHGGKVVEIVLSNPELRSLWEAEVTAMRNRIHQMRRQFVDGMKAKGVKRSFEFIVGQHGMFSFCGVTPEEVKVLKEKYGIYLVDNGRINVAAMTPGNMDYLTSAIAAVLNGK